MTVDIYIYIAVALGILVVSNIIIGYLDLEPDTRYYLACFSIVFACVWNYAIFFLAPFVLVYVLQKIGQWLSNVQNRR